MTAAPQIAVLHYGMGNHRSVAKALEYVGATVTTTREPDEVRGADGVVVLGVGAFPEAMRRIREYGLDELLAELRHAETPILGICLGLQILFDRSEEHEGARGLGFLPGEVARLESGGRRLPHIGWTPVRRDRPSRLFAGLPEESVFYHVHSFAPRPATGDVALGISRYGEEFVTAVERGSLFGVQFHPEKSSHHGLRLLANFVAVCARAGAATPR